MYYVLNNITYIHTNLQLKLLQFSVSTLTELNALNGSEQFKTNNISSESLAFLAAKVKPKKFPIHLLVYSKQSSEHGGTNFCVEMLQCGYIDRQTVYITIHRHESILPGPNIIPSSNCIILLFASV